MYRNILVPIDGSATAQRGLREALGIAAAHQASLHLLTVVDDFPMLMQMASEEGFKQTMAQVRQAAEVLLAKGRQLASEAGIAARTKLRNVTHGRVGDVIVDEARLAGCDLIVMGTHGRRGFSRLAIGSDAEHVVRIADVPVLLVRQPEALPAV
jgi:nucleotide-binding universal stress UspA family protein